MTLPFSAAMRGEYLQSMANAHFDILVIGGGSLGQALPLMLCPAD